jgi:hypothetical protein
VGLLFAVCDCGGVLSSLLGIPESEHFGGPIPVVSDERGVYLEVLSGFGRRFLH